MQLKLSSLLVAAAMLFAVSMLPTEALAACSASKIHSLHKKGIDAEEIAETCEMDEDEVQEIIDDKVSEEEERKKRRKSPGPTAQPQQSQPPRQAMCCDAYGNSRCPIVAGSTQIGSQCFCPAQGYGMICR
jgi:hypothetical protein